MEKKSQQERKSGIKEEEKRERDLTNAAETPSMDARSTHFTLGGAKGVKGLLKTVRNTVAPSCQPSNELIHVRLGISLAHLLNKPEPVL